MTKRWLILLLAVLIGGPVSAGVVYEVEVTDHEASPPRSETTEMAVEGRNLAMGIASGERRSQGQMIYRGDRREMVVVDHDDQTYMVMDQETIKELSGMVGQAMRQMQEALKNVPEEQRAMVEKMMKERMPAQAPSLPKTEIRRTGERGTREGYPCVRYDVLRDGAKVRELWVTDWANVEGGDEVRGVFGDLADFGREMMEAFSSASALPGGMGPGFGDGLFEQMEQIDGFPVVTREYDGGSLGTESTLRSARRRTLDPAAFEPPAGYKRRSMRGTP